MLEKLDYSASRTKTSLSFVSALLLAYGGYGILKENLWLGMLSLVFFGLMAIVPLVYLLDPKRYTITASSEGIVVRQVFRNDSIPWSEIDHLFVGSIRSMTTVAIAYRVTASSRPLMSMPALYNVSAREIVDALNRYRTSVQRTND